MPISASGCRGHTPTRVGDRGCRALGHHIRSSTGSVTTSSAFASRTLVPGPRGLCQRGPAPSSGVRSGRHAAAYPMRTGNLEEEEEAGRLASLPLVVLRVRCLFLEPTRPASPAHRTRVRHVYIAPLLPTDTVTNTAPSLPSCSDRRPDRSRSHGRLLAITAVGRNRCAVDAQSTHRH